MPRALLAYGAGIPFYAGAKMATFSYNLIAKIDQFSCFIGKHFSYPGRFFCRLTRLIVALPLSIALVFYLNARKLFTLSQKTTLGELRHQLGDSTYAKWAKNDSMRDYSVCIKNITLLAFKCFLVALFEPFENVLKQGEKNQNYFS